MLKICYSRRQKEWAEEGGRKNWYVTGTRFGGQVFGPLFVGTSREVSPIHHRGDEEVAGEWSGF